MALLGAVAGLAASSSVGGVDDLGSATATVDAPAGVVVTDLVWHIDKSKTAVGRVDITFAAVGTAGDCLPGDGCTAHFALKDSIGNVLAQLTVSPFELSALDTEVAQWKLGKRNHVPKSDIGFFAVTVVDPD